MVSVFFLRMIISTLLSSGIASIVSPLASLSRSIMAALQMLHAVIAGGFLGVLLHYLGAPLPPVMITLAFTLFSSLLVAELVERGFTQDSAAAISAFISSATASISGYMAAKVSATALSEAWSFLVGSAVLVRIEDLFILSSVLLIAVVLVALFYKELIFISFDEEGARAMGFHVRYYRYLLYALLSLVAVSLSISLGAIVAHILLAAPGSISTRIASSIKQIFSISLSIALIGGIIGAIIAYHLALPPGAAVGIVITVCYGVFIYAVRGRR
ncbi:MAG: hypothetical protein DRO15_05010 [Thermoprotei archaeon]|nr:MAG: hypothetical protein DRO15_05010 [Thermoprotei archaeon]